MNKTEQQQTEKPVFNPYASFPAFDRTKLEIIDAYLRALNAWKRAANDQVSNSKLQDCAFALMEWYILVHGYTKAMPKKELLVLRDNIGWPRLSKGSIITDLITYQNISRLMLTASEYMFELKITNILVHQRPDKLYLAEGAAER